LGFAKKAGEVASCFCVVCACRNDDSLFILNAMRNSISSSLSHTADSILELLSSATFVSNLSWKRVIRNSSHQASE
jgi:hypothetical protein